MKLYVSREYDPREGIELGRAIGTFFGKDRVIGVGRDGKPVCRFVRREIISGLASTGVTTFDVRLVPSIALRHVIREQGIDAGVYVSYYDGHLQVHLYDENGENADVETINKILILRKNCNFTTVGISELGTTTYYPNAMEDFVKAIHEKIDFRKDIKILVDCQGDPVSLIVEPIFEKYGIKPVIMQGFLSGYSNPSSEDFFISEMYAKKFDFGLRIERDDTKGMTIFSKGKRYHTNDWLETLAILRDL
ncbi:MAG: hypothetical protein ACPL1Y_05975 [Thermoplasmata archaeon]